MSGSTKNYYCGICSVEVSNRRKRKNITGEAAKHSVDILDNLSKGFYPSKNLKQTLKFLSPNSQYLCSNCEVMCAKYATLNQELGEIKRKFKDALMNLFQEETRSIEDIPRATSTPKRRRISSAVSPAVEVSN